MKTLSFIGLSASQYSELAHQYGGAYSCGCGFTDSREVFDFSYHNNDGCGNEYIADDFGYGEFVYFKDAYPEIGITEVAQYEEILSYIRQFELIIAPPRKEYDFLEELGIKIIRMPEVISTKIWNCDYGVDENDRLIPFMLLNSGDIVSMIVTSCTPTGVVVSKRRINGTIISIDVIENSEETIHEIVWTSDNIDLRKKYYLTVKTELTDFFIKGDGDLTVFLSDDCLFSYDRAMSPEMHEVIKEAAKTLPNFTIDWVE